MTVPTLPAGAIPRGGLGLSEPRLRPTDPRLVRPDITRGGLGGFGGTLLSGNRLTDDEQRVFDGLRAQHDRDLPDLHLSDLYYNGLQSIMSLGISLPPEIAESGLRTMLGWPRIAVDSIHERMGVDGFRYPGALDADDELWAIWQDNNLDEESDLAHLDALVFRRAFVVGGVDDDGRPLVTVESPLDMAARWDRRRRRVAEAVQFYDVDDTRFVALYLPDQTITLTEGDGGGWEVSDDPDGAEGRDQHGMGWAPVMMMSNRSRSHDRAGRSEITPEVMSITDAGVRTLLDLEVSREFYAVPQRYILGATQEAFENEDGSRVSAWQTYRGRVLALERDEEGQVPEVGTFTPYSPQAFIDVLNGYAELMASVTGLPSTYLGKTSDQPASADAIRMSTDRLVQRVRLRHKAFETAWEGAMRMALAFRDGAIPDPAKRIETIWRNPEIPTPGATTDSVQKQVAMGYMPPRSDVAGEVLGYSSLQRQRIEAEWRTADGEAALTAALARAVPPADRTLADPDPVDEGGNDVTTTPPAAGAPPAAAAAAAPA